MDSVANAAPYDAPDRGWMGDRARGAGMGRPSDLSFDTSEKIHLRRVPMVDGDYDPGGVYWGGPVSAVDVAARRGCAWLYCAWTEDGRAAYFRAWTRAEAKTKFPNARFFR